jgi:hypothetical protein
MFHTKTTLLTGLAGLSMAVLLAAPASATGWTLPPAQGFPGWETSPPQRDIYLNFDVCPIAPAGAGIPGAVYSGADDDVLKVSDFAQLTGQAQWYAGKSWVGIDNRSTGGERCTPEGDGTMTLHIDNWDDLRREKHVYLEMVYGFGGCGGWVDGLVFLPDQSFQATWTDVQFQYIGHWDDLEWYRQEKRLVVKPNPEWEEIVAVLTAPAGAAIVFDSIHIATECVPEPSTFALLALGALSLVCRGRSHHGQA